MCVLSLRACSGVRTSKPRGDSPIWQHGDVPKHYLKGPQKIRNKLRKNGTQKSVQLKFSRLNSNENCQISEKTSLQIVLEQILPQIHTQKSGNAYAASKKYTLNLLGESPLAPGVQTFPFSIRFANGSSTTHAISFNNLDYSVLPSVIKLSPRQLKKTNVVEYFSFSVCMTPVKYTICHN